MDKLKKGFTSGSCATAAAKAAACMLMTQSEIESIKIITPAGITYHAQIHEASICNNEASCMIIKESCDDPDITAGIHIYAKVEVVECLSAKQISGGTETDRTSENRVSKADESIKVYITGGEGIGIVTRPGLDQPVGNYAINSGPRSTIEREVKDVLRTHGFQGAVRVTVWAPEGVLLASKTFNPHMGIEGGISIIGTTGIVEPMSTEALLETIKTDISMQYAEGNEVCIMAPGNYGVTFLTNNYNVPEKNIVIISNFVGDAIKMCVKQGFKRILLCSHIGKLIKVSGGIMNTHSKYADDRMKLMNEAYITASDSVHTPELREEISGKILECVSTSAALDILNEIDFVKPVCEVIMDRVMYHLKAASGDNIEIECIMYENRYKELARRICCQAL